MHCEHAGKGGNVTTSHHNVPLKINHEQTQPAGRLPLGLITLLRDNERRKKPKRLNNPTAIYNNPKQLVHRVYHALPPL